MSISISIGTLNGTEGISFTSGSTEGFLSFSAIVNDNASVVTDVVNFCNAVGISVNTLATQLENALDAAGDQTIAQDLAFDLAPHGGGYVPPPIYFTFVTMGTIDDGDDAKRAAAKSSSTNRADVSSSHHDAGDHVTTKAPEHSLTAHSAMTANHSADHAASSHSALDLALTGHVDHATLSPLAMVPAEDSAVRLASLQLAQTLARHVASTEAGTVSTSQADQPADWHLTAPHS